MAGGPLAREVACMICIDEGRLVKAVRRHEGVETDQYGCERGHRFAMDFPRGPATEPEWPPPPDVVAMPSEKP